jgi:hypothetical protein
MPWPSALFELIEAVTTKILATGATACGEILSLFLGSAHAAVPAWICGRAGRRHTRIRRSVLWSSVLVTRGNTLR